jgi:hypothetical protein
MSLRVALNLSGASLERLSGSLADAVNTIARRKETADSQRQVSIVPNLYHQKGVGDPISRVEPAKTACTPHARVHRSAILALELTHLYLQF